MMYLFYCVIFSCAVSFPWHDNTCYLHWTYLLVFILFFTWVLSVPSVSLYEKAVKIYNSHKITDGKSLVQPLAQQQRILDCSRKYFFKLHKINGLYHRLSVCHGWKWHGIEECWTFLKTMNTQQTYGSSFLSTSEKRSRELSCSGGYGMDRDFCEFTTYTAGYFFSNWNSFFLMLFPLTWWRHQMETFSALLAFCAGNSSVTGEFPAQRPVTRRFDVFFDLCLNKRLSKQSRRWWFETPSRTLWRHYD